MGPAGAGAGKVVDGRSGHDGLVGRCQGPAAGFVDGKIVDGRSGHDGSGV